MDAVALAVYYHGYRKIPQLEFVDGLGQQVGGPARGAEVRATMAGVGGRVVPHADSPVQRVRNHGGAKRIDCCGRRAC